MIKYLIVKSVYKFKYWYNMDRKRYEGLKSNATIFESFDEAFDRVLIDKLYQVRTEEDFDYKITDR